MGILRIRDTSRGKTTLHLGCWPAAIVLVFGILIPLLIVLYVSFCEPLDFGGVAWTRHTFAGYSNLILDRDFDGNLTYRSAYLLVFMRSLLFASATTVTCFLLGFPTALYIATQSANRRSLFLLLVSAPFVVSLVVRAYGWVILLADGGLVNQAVNGVLGRVTGLGLLYTDIATMIGLVSIFFPFMVLPLYVSFREFDFEVAEAASTLGANPWQVLTRILIPACATGIRAGVALIFVPALGSYVIPDLLGGAKSMMIGNVVQLAFTSDRNWPLGASLSIALLCIAAVTWFARRTPLDVNRGGVGRDAREPFPGVEWIAVPTVAFLYLPIAALVITSFIDGPSALIVSGWGVKGYRDIMDDPNLLRAAWTSLTLACATVCIVSVLSVAAATTIGSTRGRALIVFEEAMKLPLVVPEIVLAVATLLAFSVTTIELDFATLVFSHVVFCLPVAYIPIRAAVMKIDSDLLDAAATLSATPWRTFWSVTLPLIWPGVLTGAILSFVTSLDDFVTSYFLGGAGVITLPTYIYGALKVGLTPKISAISTIVIATSVVLVILSAFVNKRGRSRDRDAVPSVTPSTATTVQLSGNLG
ncbi:spermidine/putrescine ABC transporter permease [Burkholderia ubonensis]|uniref:ABC transporter permease subunit n=1 Tax=Burkholderia ubonensis TaxID=101571 RepID=UPI00075F3DA2|nr:ABC transporter permease subunit [Burkholderia ubonensis]KUZ96524.1 spermidine/putrescine ABC transporter permease [Burkholderia ubonensis]